jgi:hypothetical protein
MFTMEPIFLFLYSIERISWDFFPETPWTKDYGWHDKEIALYRGRDFFLKYFLFKNILK